MKKLLILFLLTSFSIFSQDNLDGLLKKWNTRNVPYISSESLAMPSQKPILLDAREKNEFNVSHLKNAIFVGYNSFNLKETIAKLPKDKNTKIVVYCSLGVRSETIAHKLIQNGYTNVFNLYGGIFQWKNKDFEIVDTTGLKTERIHTFSKDWGKWVHKGIKVYD
jgi:rhodanese-related sulfurtransferase